VCALAALYAFIEVIMAGKAQGTLFVYNHPGDVASVDIVACEAHLFDKGHMVRAAHSLLHEVVMALNAEP
jgi:hypothetical protein